MRAKQIRKQTVRGDLVVCVLGAKAIEIGVVDVLEDLCSQDQRD